MKKTTKPTRAKKPAAPKAPVQITLHVFPHVVQTLVDGVEHPPARVLQPTDVDALRNKHVALGRVVTVEKYDAAGNRLDK